MLRRVELPTGVVGLLFLHSMPGRREPLEQVWREIHAKRLDCIVSLAGPSEVREQSPDYANAIAVGAVACERLEFAIVD